MDTTFAALCMAGGVVCLFWAGSSLLQRRYETGAAWSMGCVMFGAVAHLLLR